MFTLSSIRKQIFFTWTMKMHIYLSLHRKEASTSGHVSLIFMHLVNLSKFAKTILQSTCLTYPLRKHELSPSDSSQEMG